MEKYKIAKSNNKYYVLTLTKRNLYEIMYRGDKHECENYVSDMKKLDSKTIKQNEIYF